MDLRKYIKNAKQIETAKQYDVVVSMAVLCHLSEPLNHIKCLGQLAKKGLFIWTLVNNDEGYSIRYGEPMGDYKEDKFPVCFDNEVCISESLLRKSLELMGFKYIYEIPGRDSNLPSFGWRGYRLRGFLGMK